MTNKLFKKRIIESIKKCREEKMKTASTTQYPKVWTATTSTDKYDNLLISLCKHCNCMTKNICGKCKRQK